eukprot:11140713-Ditylum_brightwellii.AAC.1
MTAIVVDQHPPCPGHPNKTWQYMRKVLEGPEFESMYGAKVCLCPVITRTQTKETKERIRKCQARHRITMYNLTNSTKL